MDVEKSRVVICSANHAWYYDGASNCDGPCRESEAKGGKGDGGYSQASDMPIRGFRLPSDCVIEARFSGDTARCFFGTMTGHIYVVSERITFYSIGRHTRLVVSRGFQPSFFDNHNK